MVEAEPNFAWRRDLLEIGQVPRLLLPQGDKLVTSLLAKCRVGGPVAVAATAVAAVLNILRLKSLGGFSTRSPPISKLKDTPVINNLRNLLSTLPLAVVIRAKKAREPGGLLIDTPGLASRGKFSAAKFVAVIGALVADSEAKQNGEHFCQI